MREHLDFDWKQKVSKRVNKGVAHLLRVAHCLFPFYPSEYHEIDIQYYLSPQRVFHDPSLELEYTKMIETKAVQKVRFITALTALYSFGVWILSKTHESYYDWIDFLFHDLPRGAFEGPAVNMGKIYDTYLESVPAVQTRTAALLCLLLCMYAYTFSPRQPIRPASVFTLFAYIVNGFVFATFLLYTASVHNEFEHNHFSFVYLKELNWQLNTVLMRAHMLVLFLSLCMTQILNFRDSMRFLLYCCALHCVWCAYHIVTKQKEVHESNTLQDVDRLPYYTQAALNGTLFYSLKKLIHFDSNALLWSIVYQICVFLLLLFVSFHRELHERILFVLLHTHRIRANKEKQLRITTNSECSLEPHADRMQDIKREIEEEIQNERAHSIKNSCISGDRHSQLDRNVLSDNCTESEFSIQIGGILPTGKPVVTTPR